MNLDSLILIDANLELEGETVLHNINLEIVPESTTVIFGRSGSGKTTLLKSIAGLIRIDQGQVLFNGRNVAKMDEREFFKMQAQSGFVFQDSALWANKSLYDNLAIPLRILKPFMPKEDIDRRINQAVKMMQFREDLMIRPSTVSAGEKKIISFLRALMTDPDLLFLDEPSASLDKRNIALINKVIKDLKKEKKTILVVTHDFSLAKTIADNMIIIDKGKILQYGNFQEILNTEDDEISYIIKEMEGQVEH